MNHIGTVAGIPLCTKQQFYAQMRSAQLMFCAGEYETSELIRSVTDSPWSHVLFVWSGADRWLTLEATDDRGVHVGNVSDYVDWYKGALALCDVGYDTDDCRKALDAGLDTLGDGYNFNEEVQIAADRVFSKLPVTPSKTQYYCSGLQAMMSKATTHPFTVSTKWDPTPEDLWVEAQTKAICYYRP